MLTRRDVLRSTIGAAAALSILRIARGLGAGHPIEPATAAAATPLRYASTEASVRQHQVPAWYHDAKFGIFIHWSLFSVSAFAPLQYPIRDIFTNTVPAWYAPYAEWYKSAITFPESPSRRFHDRTFGPRFAYDDFVPMFNAASRRWDPTSWASLFKDAGARYVVLVTKHKEGFLLWPSRYPSPHKPHYVAERDIAGDLTAAVRARGMRMGFYYNGGDWTFKFLPIRDMADVLLGVPQDQVYANYLTGHYQELIDRYQPSVLWNDTASPARVDLPALFAHYYNRVPDGVVDNRFDHALGLLTPLFSIWPFRALVLKGVGDVMTETKPVLPRSHFDFLTPEFNVYDEITQVKWEATRGFGHGFAYNRNERDSDYLSVTQLVHLLVDVVSKNGNLLLNVGPMADGTIPPGQRERLQGIGRWLAVNGDAIYGTRPWVRFEGRALSGTNAVPVRFTQKNGGVYATVLGTPTGTVRVVDVPTRSLPQVTLLGVAGRVHAVRAGADLIVSVPAALPAASLEADAYSLRII
jgi:alpha-L-fucosidase